MTYFLGIDVAYRGATGWALVDVDGQVCEAGSIVESDTMRCYGRAVAELGLAIAGHADYDHQQVHAAIEEPWCGANRKVSLGLARRAGLWDAVCCTLGVASINRLLPSTWRAELGLPTRPRLAAKAAALAHARLEQGWETDCEDIADACCIADALRRMRGEQ